MASPAAGCPFCRRIAGGDVERASPLAVAFADEHPVAPGHTLVVPRRHEADFFALPPEEQDAVWALVREVQAADPGDGRPDGWNVGLNAGTAAGQTVMHAHVHVIPRRRGDHPDPRGGVRWVLPGRAAYWEERR